MKIPGPVKVGDIAAIGIIIAVIVIAMGPTTNEALISQAYLLMIIASLIGGIYFSLYFGKNKWKVDFDASKSDNLGLFELVLLGGVLFFLFYLGYLFNPSLFTLGMPHVGLEGLSNAPLGDFLLSPSFLTVGIIASVAESLFFFWFLINIIWFHASGDDYSKTAVTIAVIALFFTLFHRWAYGDSLSGAYAGALLFGGISAYISLKTRSVIPTLVWHSLFNSFLFMKALVVIAV